MARIGNLEFAINEKYPRPYPIFYTQKRKFEIREAPPELFTITGVSSSGYLTEGELQNAMYRAIHKYHELLKKQRLVIGYRFKASTALKMNKESQGVYCGLKEGVSKKVLDFKAFTVPSHTIGIDFKVFMEIYNGKENEYFRVDSNHKQASSSKESWQYTEGMTFIDYTDQAWEFFRNIEEAMTEMVKKMSVFFDLNAEDAALLIESNQKLIG